MTGMAFLIRTICSGGLFLACAQADIPVPQHHTFRQEGLTIQAVIFDARSHELRVVDQPNGPASRWLDAKAACQSEKALAAINAGYFTPQGKPLGKLIANGKALGRNNPSSLGSGIWWNHQKQSAIVRREKSPSRATQLLQAGPFLAEYAKPIIGLDTIKLSARSFLAWDGKNTWMISRTSPCSLANLSSHIAGKTFHGCKVVTALNLDGGTSADLYIGPQVAGGPAVYRALWNKPVRNFLLLYPR